MVVNRVCQLSIEEVSDLQRNYKKVIEYDPMTWIFSNWTYKQRKNKADVQGMPGVKGAMDTWKRKPLLYCLADHGSHRINVESLRKNRVPITGMT